MKVDSGQNHLLISGKQKVIAENDNHESPDSQNVENLLKNDIDSTLTLENHINKICKKLVKMYTFARISPYMALEKRRTIIGAFISSLLGYYPLVWLFHSQGRNKKFIFDLEMALRITCGDKTSPFQNLL